MRLHTNAGVIVSLPAFQATAVIIEMFSLVRRDLPRAKFMSETGELISVLDLRIDVEDILSLNTHHR